MAWSSFLWQSKLSTEILPPTLTTFSVHSISLYEVWLLEVGILLDGVSLSSFDSHTLLILTLAFAVISKNIFAAFVVKIPTMCQYIIKK